MIHRWWRGADDSDPERGAGFPEALAPSPEEWSRFEAHARAMTALWVPRVAAFFAIVTVAFWPLDALLDPTRRVVLAEMRVNCLGLTLSVLALSTFTNWLSVAPRLIGAVAGISGVFTLAWSVAPAGGLSQPWFHYLSTIPALSVILPVRLGRRVAATFGGAAALIGGYFLRDPSYLDHPRLASALGQTLFATLFAIVIGHQFFVLMWRGHVQRDRIEAQRRQLAELSATLEARVAAQTRELRSLARHLDSAIDTERRLLAGEIHDQLGQELTALGYVLASARRRLETSPEGVRAAVLEADRLLGRTRATMRRILARLGPQVLEQLGICEASRWAVADLAERVGLEASVDCDPDVSALDAEPTRSRALFSALLEGLNNTARHAEADSISVSLTCGSGVVCLRIVDDGLGPSGADAPPNKRAPGEGLGLIALRERARALGGEARWGPRAGGGFELMVTIAQPGGGAEAEEGAR